MLGKQTLKSEPHGFTIMETLIVLAVAGLILLLMIQAIPTLQRNSRNNQRKQDVQLILEAVSRYELNDSGKFPDDCGDTTQPVCSANTGTTPNDRFMRFTNKKLSIYRDNNGSTGSHILAQHLSPNLSTDTGYNDLDIVRIFNYKLCVAGGGATGAGAGYGDVVAQYTIETSSGTAPKCQQL